MQLSPAKFRNVPISKLLISEQRPYAGIKSLSGRSN